ncbi:MAG: hypothetical protein ABJE66_14230 [Deltaproteobacteria bacterium]
MSRVAWLVLVALAGGCKTRGTIFVGAGSCAAAPTRAIYAEPSTGCGDCDCGACIGLHTGGEVICGGSADPCETTVDFDLDPGDWAIVIAWTDSTNTVVATECDDIVVDRDGTQSPTGQTTTCSLCAP